MTINEIINLSTRELEQLSTSDLRAVVKLGATYANKRITKLKSVGAQSPAYQALPANARKAGFTGTAKTRNALINAAQAEQKFLRSKTSTVKGYNQLLNKVYKEAKIKLVDRPSTRTGFNKYGKLVVLNPGEKSVLTRRQLDLYFALYNKAIESGYIEQNNTSSKPSTNDVLADILVSVVKKHPNSKKLTAEIETELKAELKGIYREKAKEDSVISNEIKSGADGGTFKKTATRRGKR